MVPEIVISKPEGLPDPCTCGKCDRKNGCCCRVAGMSAGSTVNLKKVKVAKTQLLNDNYIVHIFITVLNSMNIKRFTHFVFFIGL